MPLFNNIQLGVIEGDLSEWINNYQKTTYMEMHCGFSPEWVAAEEVEKKDVVKDMPCYPDYGSIQVIDGVVVVKLSEKNVN